MSEKHEDAMINLWGFLTVELGSAFCRQYGDIGGKLFLDWSKDLSCFTEQQLVNGLQRFKRSGSTYMSLNIFRKHCQPDPSDFGICAMEAAYDCVMRKKWERIHPAFQHVCASMVYNLAQAENKHGKQYKQFKPVYDDIVKRVASGEEFERIIAIAERTNPSGVIVTKKNKDIGNDTLKKLLRK